jgi:hypothetical protein
VFVAWDEERDVERRDRVEVCLGGVFGVGAKAAHEEGGYEGLGCLCYDMVEEVLFGASVQYCV